MTEIPALRPAPPAVGVFAVATAEVVLTRLGFQLALPRDACLAFDLLASGALDANRFIVRVNLESAKVKLEQLYLPPVRAETPAAAAPAGK